MTAAAPAMAYAMVAGLPAEYGLYTAIMMTAVGAIFDSSRQLSIEFCVLIGIFMSFMLAVPRAGRMLLTEFVLTPDGGVQERLPDDAVCERMLIFGLEGELFFGAT